VVRELTADQIRGLGVSASSYVKNWQRFSRELTPRD
jgi:hypothetical protein